MSKRPAQQAEQDREGSTGTDGCELCGGSGLLYDLAARLDVPCECKDKRRRR